jgi:hypothetical protein
MARAPKAQSSKKRSTTSKGRTAKASPAKKQSSKASKARGRKPGPTRVMGVTVPKTLTSALDSLVNSPRGREILASALVAAATAAAAALVKRADSPQVAKARDAANEASDQVASATKDLTEVAAGAVAEIVTGAARSLLPASMTGGPAGRQDRRGG